MMILSFHPCFEADKNIICAGREPGGDDLTAIKAADAVILPQGCYQSLYEMAQENCSNVFPNYDARFRYPDKIGQIKLFEKTGVMHPKTAIFQNVNSFYGKCGKSVEKIPYDFPFVFKFNWGGEGDTVFLIKSYADLQDILQRAVLFESPDCKGFLLQEYIPSQNRSLRVVVIGQTVISYWRIQKNREIFGTSMTKGAIIDTDADPHLQDAAAESVKAFCIKTGINLAGFDYIFSSADETGSPIFLEINYFFGRQGLGGSKGFYARLETEIKKWIDSLDSI